MRRTSDELSSATRIASSPIMLAPWTRAAASAARFMATGRALPTLFRTPMVAHALTPRVPAPRQLRALVSALHGRLSVVNPPHAIRLPAGLGTAVRGLVRSGFDAKVIARDDWDAGHARQMVRSLLSALPPSIRDGVSSGADWAAAGLYESATPHVRRIPSDEDRPTRDPAHAVAEAEIVYRMGVVVGSGTTPPDWQAIDRDVAAADAIAWPLRKRPRQLAEPDKIPERGQPWFMGVLLVPDEWLSAHSDPEMLAYWARLTGRSGEPDRYWFPETWDRFLEPGRRVGWLTANDVWRRRRGRLPTAASFASETPSLEWAARRSDGMPLTPDLERGVGVPPGYALVRCAGTLEVAFVTNP